ncbi:MAG: hypothetical protein ACETVP_01350 [Candidatus Bathyarchaeia archaeon]|jgi:hypothetical protein
MQKFNNPEVEQRIIDLLEETSIPCSIEYVAQRFDLAWGTARAILLDLAVRGQVKIQKTTKSLIFWVEKKKEVQSVMQEEMGFVSVR